MELVMLEFTFVCIISSRTSQYAPLGIPLKYPISSFNLFFIFFITPNTKANTVPMPKHG